MNILNEEEKLGYLVKLFKKYIYETEKDYLNELDKESNERYYYKFCDINIEEIVSYVYNMFSSCKTKKDIDQKMKEFLGYYSGNELVSQDGVNYLYIQQ